MIVIYATKTNSTTNVPVGSLISSAQGNIVTPKLTTTAQPPFMITLSHLIMLMLS